MRDQTELILIACLDRLEMGESIDEILQRHPDVAAELRPVLETAVLMNQLAISPTLAAKEKSKTAMLRQAETLRNPKTRPIPWVYRLRQMLLPVAALALLLVMLGAVLVPVSASALPGDTLYGLKRQVEAFQLARTSDPEALLELVATLRDERQREIAALLRSNRDAVVELEGVVEDKNDATWQIAGFETQITAVTELIGLPEVGDLVLVNGHTSGGHLFADKIIMQSDDSQPVVPTHTHTPTATLTITPSATATSVATSTPTQTPTATITPSPTATSELTATIEPAVSLTPTALPTLPPQPTATAAPTRSEDNNNNDNSNENGDDSGGSNNNDNDDDNSGSGNNNNDNDNEDDNSGSGKNNNDNDNDNDGDNSGSGNNNNDNDNDNDDDNSGKGNDNNDNDNG